MIGHPDDLEPDLSVTDGQLTIGLIYEAGDKFTATDCDGNPLGSFLSLDAARSAVIHNRLAQRRETSRHE